MSASLLSAEVVEMTPRTMHKVSQTRTGWASHLGVGISHQVLSRTRVGLHSDVCLSAETRL